MKTFYPQIEQLFLRSLRGSLGAGTGGSEALGARNKIHAATNAAAMLANQNHTPIPGGRKTARPTPPSSAGILAEKMRKKSRLRRTVTALEIRVAQRRPHMRKIRVNPRTKFATQATDPTRIPSHPSNSAAQPNQVSVD
jgi:hypothetical protein